MTRPRKFRLSVWCTFEEKETIEENARQTGLSISTYLRTVGRLEPVKTHIDYDAIKDLTKLQGDLGRVAGLLKLWLVTNNGKGGVPNDINQMMISFRELQKQIFEKVSTL
ncbi:conjugal transfer protein TraJ (plasmid) [Bartonella kosoyi]|uniref:Conjugal transfer protein TraJ n=1 Tax=Bartonella kosoyi TaxID=2133959 RepID=A0A5B9RMG5_9HYPH|nr:conjugal transfer protein TraJ [Bartonella kosoyi]QEG79299.1 conjugal transfer protein TraJ [Bartonella kosoyi]